MSCLYFIHAGIITNLQGEEAPNSSSNNNNNNNENNSSCHNSYHSSSSNSCHSSSSSNNNNNNNNNIKINSNKRRAWKRSRRTQQSLPHNHNQLSSRNVRTQ